MRSFIEFYSPKHSATSLPDRLKKVRIQTSNSQIPCYTKINRRGAMHEYHFELSKLFPRLSNSVILIPVSYWNSGETQVNE